MSEWHPMAAQTDGVPMVDAGIGRPYVLKEYTFLINPGKVKELEEKGITVTNQEIFDNHWPQIRLNIWSEGLVAIQDSKYPPRVVISKKVYRIFIVCEPKFGRVVHDKPKTLQEVFKKKLTK